MEFAEILDSAGRKWSIKLRYRIGNYDQPYDSDKEANKRYEMISGWGKFYKENGLNVGDKLEFEHVRGCMMLVNKKVE